MKIAIGCDHAGFQLKQQIKQFLHEQQVPCLDVGTDSEAPADYPDFALSVSRAVLEGRCDRGIMICGTGIGSAMAANKIPGIRAAVCHETFSARLSRSHNDANVLCLGARVIGVGLALEVVKVWLAEEFSAEERHERRLCKVANIESSQGKES